MVVTRPSMATATTAGMDTTAADMAPLVDRPIVLRSRLPAAATTSIRRASAATLSPALELARIAAACLPAAMLGTPRRGPRPRASMRRRIAARATVAAAIADRALVAAVTVVRGLVAPAAAVIAASAATAAVRADAPADRCHTALGADAATIGIPSDANIISDRVIGNEAPEEAPPGDNRSTGHAIYSPFRLTANKRPDGSGAFEAGVTSYRGGSYTVALTSFEKAASAEPDNALYLYYIALSQFEMSGAEAAQDALQKAVERESREPVANWGKACERVQGRGRVWIEKARREAGLVR